MKRLLLLTCLLVPALPGSDVQTERLIALGKLWAESKYFHPYLAYRDIDWDAALIQAIPKVKAASTPEAYAAAIENMLHELSDPVTRVIAEKPVRHPELQSGEAVLNEGDVLVLRFSGFRQSPKIKEQIRKSLTSLRDKRGLVLDLRSARVAGWDASAWALLEADITPQLQGEMKQRVSTTPLWGPGQRIRMHTGLTGMKYVDNIDTYYSAFQVTTGKRFMPAAAAVDIPVVFLFNEYSDIPVFALALQAAGKGLIVAEGRLNEESLVRTKRHRMPDGVEVQLRLSELIRDDGTGGLTPDLTITAGDHPAGDAALKAAIDLAQNPKITAGVRGVRLPAVGSPPLEEPYYQTPYPDVGHRLLAVFRIWSVFEYFFAYKDLMGEDWDAVLQQFLPRMESARTAEEYNLAVAAMLTHAHDSHISIRSRALFDYFGVPAAVDVRWIENQPVVTSFRNPIAAKEAGIEVGDVILAIDGEPARSTIDRLAKYIPSSTPQALTRNVMDVLLNGKDGTAAVVMVRGRNDLAREVKVPRSRQYPAVALPHRGDDKNQGEALRLIDPEIGYADLRRVDNSTLATMFEKFKNTRAIIMDIRQHHAVDGRRVARWLTDKENVPMSLYEMPLVIAAEWNDYDMFSQPVQSRKAIQAITRPEKWTYKGQTVLLIDEYDQSSDEHIGLFLEVANGTKFIGSATAGASGVTTVFWAPGGIQISFTGSSVRHADGRQLQRLGLQPDVEVHPTVAGIRAGRDEVLDRAIEYVRSGR